MRPSTARCAHIVDGTPLNRGERAPRGARRRAVAEGIDRATAAELLIRLRERELKPAAARRRPGEDQGAPGDAEPGSSSRLIRRRTREDRAKGAPYARSDERDRLEAPRVGLEPTTLRLTAGCSAN